MSHTNSQTYRKHLNNLKALGHEIHEIESIHHDERDFHSIIYTKNADGKRVCNTVAYCDPAFSQYSESHYEIYELGEVTKVLS